VAGTIGGQSCSLVKGAIPTVRIASKAWTVPGMNGVGLAVTGANDGAFELTAVLYSSLVAVGAWSDAIYAMQGTIVAVTNDLAQSSSYVFLKKVHTCTVKAARIPGTTVAVRGELKIEAIRTQ